MRQTPRSTTATASSGPGSVIAAPHSRPRSTSSSPPRPGQKTRKALASGPRLQPFPGLAHDDVGVEVGQQADPAVLAGWRRGVAGQGSSRERRPLRPAPARRVRQSGSQRASLGPRLRPMPARLHRPRQRGDRARRTGRRIVVGRLPPATTALYEDGTRRPAPPARPDGKPDARRNEQSAACKRRLTCPELISPSSHSGEDGFRRLVHPDGYAATILRATETVGDRRGHIRLSPSLTPSPWA